MEFELTDILAKHKTEQFGASYDTDYKVIASCTPDCPACAQRELVKYLTENMIWDYPHDEGRIGGNIIKPLLKHFELEGE